MEASTVARAELCTPGDRPVAVWTLRPPAPPARHLLAAGPAGPPVQVRVATPVRPTEDPARVREALLRFFPGYAVEATDGGLAATGAELRPLRQRVWELRIIDTFRGQFLHGMDAAKRTTRFRLSKQAALAGKVSFSPRPHALGDLDVEVRLEEGDPFRDLEALAAWIAPETKDGEIVGPVLP